MFALWNAAVLGLMSPNMQAVDVVVDPIERLRQGGWARPGLGLAISAFSEFAIATSFIGFTLGLLNVFKDIFSSTFQSTFQTNRQKLPLYALIFLPPLVLSVIEPNIFFDAIELAGAFGNSILFGIIPALMAWKSRDSCWLSERVLLVPGGRGLLIGMIAIATGIIIQNALTLAGIL